MRSMKRPLPTRRFPGAIFHWAPFQGLKYIRSSFIAVESRKYKRFISRLFSQSGEKARCVGVEMLFVTFSAISIHLGILLQATQIASPCERLK